MIKKDGLFTFFMIYVESKNGVHCDGNVLVLESNRNSMEQGNKLN